MTSWQPYPSSSQQPQQTQEMYEPYPTTPSPRITEAPRTSQELLPYQAYEDPFLASRRPSVSFPQAVSLAVKNWENYSGRASRSEFWWPAIMLVLADATIGNGSEAAFASFETAAASGSGPAAVGLFVLGTVLALLWLAVLVPMLSLAVRRFHDTDRSGWFALVALIPVVGYIAAAVLLAQDSKRSGARYDNPARPPHGPESL